MVFIDNIFNRVDPCVILYEWIFHQSISTNVQLMPYATYKYAFIILLVRQKVNI